MKREVRILRDKALDSLFLSVDHFNRPYDLGRHEAVLIFLDRAFELLLKATIAHRGGRIREPRASQTIGFGSCVRKCISDVKVKCLTENEAITIRAINGLRDAAQHYIVILSERYLYLYAQAGLTLFEKILKDVFGSALTDYYPDRVLPITTKPPESLGSVIDADFEDIRRLAAPNSRRRFEAQAKLRSLAIAEASLQDQPSQPSAQALSRYVRQVTEGKDWTELFPGVASLQLDASGTGLSVSLRITRSEGEPVHLVSEGTPDAATIAVKRVNELSFYSLGLKDLAKKVGVTMPRTLAIVRALSLQDNPEYFKEIRVGRSVHKRYSAKALDLVKKELPGLDLTAVWSEFGPGHR